MRKLIFIFGLFSLALSAAPPKEIPPAQGDYEKDIQAIVRNKLYYKAGKFELAAVAGVMPYDSLVNHFMVGGRAAWHITDHFGWEIADGLLSFPSVTSYTTNLVSQNGIVRLDTVKIKYLFGTNILISPLYGKLHFVHRWVSYFDVYAVLGGGVAGTNVARFATTGTTTAPNETDTPGTDPMFDFGVGIKFYFLSSAALVFDLRDYVVSSAVYDAHSFKSNFSVFLGMSFFLPTF